MSHFVPDFETEDDFLLPASSNLKRHKKSTMADEDIMELLWQNGQVVMQSQNQRPGGGNKKAPETTSSREIRSSHVMDDEAPCNLFMQEDEMVSWLHYPNEDNNLDLYLHNNDMVYPGLPSSSHVINTTASQLSPPRLPVAATINVPLPRPPAVPTRRVEEEQIPKFSNFLHFSRSNNNNKGNLTGGTGSAPVNTNRVSQELTQSTIVESNGRPEQSRASRMTESCAPISGAHHISSFGGASSAGREPETYDLTASSSPGTGGSGASASIEPLAQKPPEAPKEDRKRKGRDCTEDTECYSEDAEFEYPDAKKLSRGSTSTKRSRAAEVHNLSERRRRDRINEKMKALQELIPRCNKSDKASMLDEAIEYLKSLQMQVQMMSMGYSMVPMMFPGVQRYMPTMAAAAMGMPGMGMDQVAGMNRPIVPYPPVLPGSAIMPNPAAHLTQRFPVPRFPMPQVPIMGPARTQGAPNPPDHPMMMNAFPMQNANQPRNMVPFADPYQQYTQMPVMPQPQNQTGVSAVTSKPSSSKHVKGPEHHPTG